MKRRFFNKLLALIPGATIAPNVAAIPPGRFCKIYLDFPFAGDKPPDWAIQSVPFEGYLDGKNKLRYRLLAGAMFEVPSDFHVFGVVARIRVGDSVADTTVPYNRRSCGLFEDSDIIEVSADALDWQPSRQVTVTGYDQYGAPISEYIEL